MPISLNTTLYYDLPLNSIGNSLVDSSSLTQIQIETIKLQQAIAKSEISLQDATRLRKNPPISKGTHYRILAQAKGNVKKSIITTVIAVQLGIVRREDLLKLLEWASNMPVEVDDARLERASAIVEALVKRIVML